MNMNMIDHDDLWQVLAQHPGCFVEYTHSMAVNGPKVTQPANEYDRS